MPSLTRPPPVDAAAYTSPGAAPARGDDGKGAAKKAVLYPFLLRFSEKQRWVFATGTPKERTLFLSTLFSLCQAHLRVQPLTSLEYDLFATARDDDNELGSSNPGSEGQDAQEAQALSTGAASTDTDGEDDGDGESKAKSTTKQQQQLM